MYRWAPSTGLGTRLPLGAGESRGGSTLPARRSERRAVAALPDAHTCASLLFQRNVHPKFVQELLGHASVVITLDTYSHMLPGMGGEATDAMGDALG